MQTVTFVEEQAVYRTWYGKLMIAFAVAWSIWMAYRLLSYAEQASSGLSLVVEVATLFLLLAIGCSSLRTSYSPGGVRAVWQPYGIALKDTPRSAIATAAKGCVSPIAEFGGWGWRWRPGAQALLISGHEVVDLTLTSGKRLVISSGDGDAAVAALG